MEISAHIRNDGSAHQVRLRTGGTTQPLAIAAREAGQGSAVNGGELLMAALATCYCNDLYREAARLGIAITGCEVVATAQFNGVGLAAESVVYSARVRSPAAPEQVEALLDRRPPAFSSGRLWSPRLGYPRRPRFWHRLPV